MTIETTVFAALNALAPAGGVWPNVAPDDNLAWPKIIYSRVSGVPNLPLAGGAPAYEDVRLQVDVYSQTYGEAKTVAESIKAAMVTLQSTVANWLLNNQDLFEQDAKLHRVTMDFGIRG